MVCFRKDGMTMTVSENTATSFERNGWVRQSVSGVPVCDNVADVVVEDKREESPDAPVYTKTDISRMNLDNLKSLATELGIEVTDESTGNKLKPAIIEKLGL